jgi:hypothetical protein
MASCCGHHAPPWRSSDPRRRAWSLVAPMIAIGFGVDSRRRLGSLTVMVPRLPPDAVRAQCRAPSSYFPGRVIGSRIGRPDRRCRASSGRERSHLQRRRFRKVRHRHSQSVGGVTSDVEIILKRKLFSRDRRLATTEDCPRNGVAARFVQNRTLNARSKSLLPLRTILKGGFETEVPMKCRRALFLA